MSLSSTQIQQLYVAYFGRPADPGGLAFYANADLASVVQAFSASPESQALYGGAGSATLINAIYQNLFNRPAEPAGLAAWAALLAGGQISPAALALNILQGAANEDQQTIGNKVAAAALFTSYVAAQSATSAYAGATAAASARAFLQTVSGDSATVPSAQGAIASAVASALNLATSSSGNSGPSVNTILLTTGVDHIVGTAGDDLFLANVSGAFGSGDRIDGGGGNDTLTITNVPTYFVSSGITVVNVQTVNFSTTTHIASLNTTTWTGLTTLNYTAPDSNSLTAGTGTAINATINGSGSSTYAGFNGGSSVTVNAHDALGRDIVAAGATGPIVVNSSTSQAAQMDNINTTGGTTVSVTQTASNAAGTTTTLGAISIYSSAITTSVTVANAPAVAASSTVAGVSAAYVGITDTNTTSGTLGTITTVSVDGGAGLGITDNNLQNLTAAHLTGGGSLIIDTRGGAANSPTTLNLTLNTDDIGTLSAGGYTTFNLTAIGSTSINTLWLPTLATLNLSGTGALAVGGVTDLGALQAITISGSAGLTGTGGATYDLSSLSNLSTISTTASTGTSAFGLDPSHTSYSGGTGRDTVMLGNATLGAGVLIDGGTGSGLNTLVMAADDAQTDSGSGSTFATQVRHFQTLQLTSAGTQTIDLALLGNSGAGTATTFTTVQVAGGGDTNGSNMTLNNFAANGTLMLTGTSPGGYTLVNPTGFAGNNDTLNVKLSDGSGQAVNFTNDGGFGGDIVATGLENIVLNVADTQATPSGTFQDSVSFNDAGLQKLTVTGNAGVAVRDNALTLSMADASGMTLGNFTLNTSTTQALTVKGTSSGSNIINLGNTSSLNYSGGAVTIYTADGAISTISIAAHNSTVANRISIGSSGSTHGNNISAISSFAGLNNGGADTIYFSGTGGATGSVTVVQASDVTGSGGNVSQLADWIAAATGATGSSATGMAEHIYAFQFQGNTYLVETVAAGSGVLQASDTVVQLVGTGYTFNHATVSNGVLTLAG